MIFLFFVICWSLAAILGASVFLAGGFPLSSDTHVFFQALLSIFLFLLPFSKSLSLGGLFKFETNLAEVKKEIDTFKEETRSNFSLQSSNLLALTSQISQHTTINLPPLSVGQQAYEKISEHSAEMDKNADSLFGEFLSESENDRHLALAKLRMNLESELRELLGARTSINRKTSIKFRSLRNLWAEYLKRYPEKEYLSDGFRFANDVANSAIHAQQVPEGYAEEALQIGLRILNDIREVKAGLNPSNSSIVSGSESIGG
ncbi:hypothetical protein PsAD13_04799 [Pseudovibrio sp. Ad13]|uniref:hypothetical protein n=1 Tax=unclassified Pseudovibrio TaxID=2627060 RepID=UPI0007AEC734|nr:MULTISPECIES: hypothetical protein [unclassified Pseudovibrio]KZK76491.1 hypothetical protein PsAD46_05248 [Pseudovibrio sp. Ad46]KZK79811.1 hypothetical protein PsAD13_04799 [Pseudovibrio sp. Ad13]